MQKRFKIIGWCFALVALHVCAACGSFAAELAWPEVTQETKPWTRWWWLGNICTDAGLQAAMEQYAAVGLGGLEITPLYGVLGEEEKFIQYLSPEWVDRLEFVLKEGKRLGLGIDMNNGTGWPFGGPWVTPEDTCKYLAYKKFTVWAGEKLGEPVVMVEKGMVSPRSVSLSQITEPFGETPELQKLMIDNLKMPGALKLNTLMAFSDTAGGPLNLTDKVADDGTLNWTAPVDGGMWTLYAVFNGLHSRMVKRAAPGGEGHAPDHFSAGAIQHYLAKFDEAFKGRNLGGLRAFFCDSYEVDEGTVGEANFTPKFFDEFQRRRGYDLRLHLPVLLGNEQSDEKTRLLCDWRETMADLLLDDFTKTWRQWGAGYGKIVRYQAHGSPGNVLDLYAAADIPETEGYGRPTDAVAELKEQVAMMYASSAAHVTGKQLASSETCTWLDDHFLTTLGHAKHRIDTHFLAGINHVVYHGTTYSPPEEAWPGFLFYAAVEFCPVNSWWDDFATLNQYVTRCQSFLQAGQPDNDVLLYAPFFDRWMQRGNGKMPHFVIGGSFPGQEIGQELVKTGYCFDFISDQLLQNVAYLGGKLHKGGNRYQAIVLPETNYVPLATMEKLIALAHDGAVIVVQKSLPGDVPGFGDLDARRAEFKSVMAALQQSGNVHEENGVVQISVGEGRFLIGERLPELLALAHVRQEKLREKGIEFVRRREGNAAVYFLVNRSGDFFDGWAPLAVKMPKSPAPAELRSAALFDPQNGHIGNAAVRGGDLESIEVYLQLAPGQSCIVQCGARGDTDWTYLRSKSSGEMLTGKWDVSFVKGGPSLPAAVQLDRLQSWTEVGGEEGKVFSGTAKYTLEFPKPQMAAEVWRLDLGRVAESARVVVNGKDLGTLIAAPFAIDIPADKLRDLNTLEVFVSNLMANRIADMDRRDVPWKRFYNVNMAALEPANRGANNLFSAAKWQPRESGLIGPVMLAPMEKFNPASPNS